MVRRLDLSDEQRASIEPILKESWRDISTMGLDFMDRIEAVLQQNGERIRLHLQPEQVEKFDRIVNRFHNKSRKWRQRLGQDPSSP